MSLLDTMREPCVMMDKTSVPDGMGGFIPAYKEGAEFEATIIKDNSLQAVVAQQQGLAETFTVIVNKSVPLVHLDVFKRLSDGETFRMTSSTKDSAAPSPSTIPIAKATCERWTIS